MIKINLAKRKVAAGGGAPGETRGTSGLGGLKLPAGLAKITLDTDQIKELPIRKFLIPIVIGIGASYYSDNTKEVEMQKATELVTKLSSERAVLTNSAGKIKSYEAMKKSMDADEAMIRGKIDTIQKLIADRTNPPKILRSLSSAIPKDVWLSEFRAGEKDVTFRGYSIDFNQISDFIKNLNESAFFRDAVLRGGAQQVKDETGTEVYSLDLTAQRR